MVIWASVVVASLGFGLGLWTRTPLLIVATALVALISIFWGIKVQASAGSIAGSTVLLVSMLQGGYLLGAFVAALIRR